MANQDHGSQAIPGANFALPGVILAIFAVYGYLFLKPDLQSARPAMSDGVPPPPSAQSLPGVHSRLWQDPLESAYQSQKLEGSWIEKRLQRSIHRASRNDRLKDMQDRLATMLPKDGKKKLIVMPVLVPGGPYDDDKETRLRTRYAVLAGLHHQSYSLAYPERMSYIELPVTVHVPPKRNMPLEEMNLVVPIKLFTPDIEQAPQVLVMWINQDQLGLRPLSTLAQIIDRAFPNAPPRRLSIRMIGPTNSDMLKVMLDEDAAYAKGERSVSRELRGYWLNARYFSKRYHEPTIYSPYATFVRTDDASRFVGGNAQCFTGVQIVRTVGSDKELIEALLHELTLRFVAIGEMKESDKIIFIAERDTVYGRYFEAYERKDIVPKLRSYSYLRGIDGRLPNGDADGLSVRDSGSDERNEHRGVVEGTVGRSQLDYLRRLERHIVSETRREHGRVVAVGIFGSDVYDKLLILRALRKNYPGACFFTTDLDARLLNKQEYPYARNLIVASHFGFQLHPDHQADIPPFRGSYQTACFLAVQLALDASFELDEETTRELLKRDPWGLNSENAANRLQPLVFEVAREGAYQLTTTKYTAGLTAALQPRSPREQPWVRWHIVAAAIAFLSACLCLQVRSTKPPALRPFLIRTIAGDLLSVLLLGLTVGLIWAIACDHVSDKGEPFLLFSGISVWPATLLRYAARIAGAGLLRYSYLSLRQSEDQLRSQYQLGAATCPSRWSELRPKGRWWKCNWWGDLLLPRATLCESNGSGEQLWQDYARRGHWVRRMFRVLFMTSCYFACAASLYRATEFPSLPARGDLAYWISFCILMASVLATLGLSFFVLDAVQLCGRFVKDVSQQPMTWPSGSRPDDAVQERITVELIADRTLVVGKLLKYPFAVWLLVIGSRLFDYMPFRWPLVVVIGLVLLGMSASYVGLKRTAENSRRRVLKRLDFELLKRFHDRDPAHAADSKIEREKIREVITQIREQSEGAFRPLTRDLLFQALALPFGGVRAAGDRTVVECLKSTRLRGSDDEMPDD